MTVPEPSAFSLALDTTRPFTRGEALAAGITARQLRGTGYQPLFHGIYLLSSVAVTPLIRARAALLPFTAAHASHATAARVWQLPIPVLPEEHVTVTRRNARHARAGIVRHSAPEDACSTTMVDDVLLSDPLQTFVDLGELITLVDLVVVGDELVRRNVVTCEMLRAFCGRSRHPGARRAATAATFVRAGVDSPMESRTRMLLVLGGLPEPDVNPTVYDELGHPIRRYDLYYKRSRTAIEYDGRQHAQSQRQWESDVSRRESIDDAGDRLVVLLAKDIYKTPSTTLVKVHRILRERGEPGVPTRLSEEWRRYFPGQA